MISNLVHLHETQQQAVKYVFNLQRNCILYYAAQTAWPLKRGLQESHLVTEYEVQAVGPGWENTRALSNTHCMYSLKVIGHLEKKKKITLLTGISMNTEHSDRMESKLDMYPWRVLMHLSYSHQLLAQDSQPQGQREPCSLHCVCLSCSTQL